MENITEQQPKLLDQVRSAIRLKHYSLRTEQAYVYWISQYILFHDKQHPKDMGEQEITQFLSHLAVQKNVAASTQNQALCALIFLYRQVLNIELGELGNVTWAKRPKRLPVVFTKDEVRRIFNHLAGEYKLMVIMLYGAGLRLTECLELRVKDIDFESQMITVRGGKGEKDRVTILPESVMETLKLHIESVEKIHKNDIKNGYDSVYMPYALERKYLYPVG